MGNFYGKGHTTDEGQLELPKVKNAPYLQGGESSKGIAFLFGGCSPKTMEAHAIMFTVYCNSPFVQGFRVQGLGFTDL